jgi:2-dehydro-3-deoxy-D-arabinonate dehydratase
MEVARAAQTVFTGETSTRQMRREPADLARWLGAALCFPAGAVLLTGTGIVPGPPFTLTAGDTVAITIGALGLLVNPVELLRTGLPARERDAAAGA